MAAEAERELAKVKKEESQGAKDGEGEGTKTPAEPARGQSAPEAAQAKDGGTTPELAAGPLPGNQPSTGPATAQPGAGRPPEGEPVPDRPGSSAKAGPADPHDHPPAGCQPCLSQITRRIVTYA